MPGLDTHDLRSNKGNNFLQAVVEALITFETVKLSEQQKIQSLNYAHDFVQSEIQSLPLMLRALFFLGMMSFRFLVVITQGSGFSKLPLEKRKTIIQSWAWGRVALARQLFRVIRSTALLAFYEFPDVKTNMIPPDDKSDLQVAPR